MSRCAAKESKKIEQAGGYQFAQQTVPGGFNFGEKSSLALCTFIGLEIMGSFTGVYIVHTQTFFH